LGGGGTKKFSPRCEPPYSSPGCTAFSIIWMSDMMTSYKYVSTFLENGRFVTIYRSYTKNKWLCIAVLRCFLSESRNLFNIRQIKFRFLPRRETYRVSNAKTNRFICSKNTVRTTYIWVYTLLAKFRVSKCCTRWSALSAQCFKLFKMTHWGVTK